MLTVQGSLVRLSARSVHFVTQQQRRPRFAPMRAAALSISLLSPGRGRPSALTSGAVSMSTSAEYLDLAAHFKAAAEACSDERQFELLHDLAKTYFILWKSSCVLQASVEVLNGRRQGAV